MLPRRTLALAVTLILLVAGCSNNETTAGPAASGTPPAAPSTFDDSPGLVPVRMHPAEPQTPPFESGKLASSIGNELNAALRQAVRDSQQGAGKQASWSQSDLQRDGSDYNMLLPSNKVEKDLLLPAVLNFMPTYGDGGAELSDLAYAMYKLPLDDYGESGLEQTIALEFVIGPSDSEDFWIGLGDVNKQSWSWFPYEDDGVITIDSFTQFEQLDGSILMVLIGLGQETIALDKILIGLFEARATGDTYIPFTPPFEIPGLPLYFNLTVDLSPQCSPINDQGQIGSCTAFASGDGALNYEFGQLYPCWNFSNLRHLMAPRFIYNQTGADFFQGCPEAGRSTDDVGTWLVNMGTSSELNAPYGSRNKWLYDCGTAWTAAALADRPWLHADGKTFIGLYNSTTELYRWDDARVNQVRSLLLSAQKVVVFRTYLDSAFGMTDYAGGESWTYSGPSIGGHAMVVVGYDDDLNGGSFKVRNSWGTSFGDNGYCYITYDSMKSSTAGVYGYTLNLDYHPTIEDEFCPLPVFRLPENFKVLFPLQPNKVVLTWTKPENVMRYEIYRDFKSFNPIGTPSASETMFEDLSLEDFNTHVYWIKAVYDQGESGFSQPVFGWREQPPG